MTSRLRLLILMTFVACWSGLPAQSSLLDTFNKAKYNLETGDVVSALSLFREAAGQGYAPAQSMLAWILDGSNQDDEAVEWYRKAAAQSHAAGQFGLGEMYIKGEGVEIDLSRALELITAAAEQDHTRAIHRLVDAYEFGRMGLEADHDAAVMWLQRGMDINDRWSVERLAKAYERGELGLAVDQSRASELVFLAKSMNDIE